MQVEPISAGQMNDRSQAKKLLAPEFLFFSNED
jgi:hypothetical protein